MSKRKRGDEEDAPDGVGLGATLALLRNEEGANDATTPAANDDEGWTVVGSKKRRKESDSNHHSSRKGPHSHRSDRHRRSRSNEARRHDNRREESEERSRSPSRDALPQNPKKHLMGACLHLKIRSLHTRPAAMTQPEAEKSGARNASWTGTIRSLSIPTMPVSSHM
jgi:hypothetical protein